MEPTLVELLSEDEIQEYLTRLTSLRSEWRTHRDESLSMPYYLLGAASYLDAKENTKAYYKIKNYYNRILLENFSDLYDKVLSCLEEYLGPAVLEDSLAYPGFNIMGDETGAHELTYLEFPSDYLYSRHQDHIYNYHLDVLNEKYKIVDLEDNFSFTLSLKLPSVGSGLSLWCDTSLKKYETSQQFEIDLRDNGFYKGRDIEEPSVVPYQEGGMFIFSGNLYHQVPPLYKYYLDDRRITLQGHSVLCDGIWRVYF